METKPYGTVLIKASAILDYLAEYPKSKLQEIATGTKMTASNAIKILDTLLLIGYVEKNQQKEFYLGTKFIRYAQGTLSQFHLSEIADEYLEELQEKVNETIHLGVLENDHVLYLKKIEPKNQTITMSSKVGITRPLYSSAMGKAMLAYFSKKDFASYLKKEEPLKAYTENTITNPLRLKKEIAEVKQTHVAFDNEETEKDIFCLGVALISGDEMKGAFSISMPKYRLTEEKKKIMVKEILNTKEKIEQKIAGNL